MEHDNRIGEFLRARHDVGAKADGEKSFVHPIVGRLDLRFETFTVNGTDGQQLIVYHAEPASPTAQRLALLGSMVAEQAGA